MTSEILGMDIQTRVLISLGIIIAAYLVDFLLCRFVIPVVRKIARKTTFKWDDYLAGGKILHNVFHLIPPIVFQMTLPFLFPEQTFWTEFAAKFLSIYIIVIICRIVCEFISSLYGISGESDALKDKPMKGVYQMLKVIVVCLAVIVVIGILIDKDFTTLIAGLGAMATVLMLIFKDTILGLVAGVQLSAYDMVRPGDWIVLERYNVDGIVLEVNLNTVKVRNWDNTTLTVPPYVLISDSFQNWRGMRESGGRRVARALKIDMNSIRFCTPEEKEKFAGKAWAADIAMDKDVVNLKLFRLSIEYYLRSLSEVNKDLWILVRQLEPTSEGLPLQFYFFTIAKDWVPHEHIAADVMEHILASMPDFGLRVFQKPTGFDIGQHITRQPSPSGNEYWSGKKGQRE